MAEALPEARRHNLIGAQSLQVAGVHLGAQLPAYEFVDHRDFGNFSSNLSKHFSDAQGEALKRKLRDERGEQQSRVQAALDAHLFAQSRLPAAPLVAKALTKNLRLQLLQSPSADSMATLRAASPVVTAGASPGSPPAPNSTQAARADPAADTNPAAADPPPPPQAYSPGAGTGVPSAADSPTACPPTAEPPTAEPPSIRHRLEEERCQHYATLRELHTEREVVSSLRVQIATLETENARLREVCPHPLPCPPPRLPLCLSLYKLSIMRDHAPRPYLALPNLSLRACLCRRHWIQSRSDLRNSM